MLLSFFDICVSENALLENNTHMDSTTNIKICLGSSCFSRGNKQSVRIIKEYIDEHKMGETVFFSGAHCFGKCADGPMIKINDVLYKKVEPTDVRGILDEFFNKL